MKATVIVPTHDHGPLLALAVRSALDQTVRELELVIVGDGVTPETRDVALELERADERVTFLDRPKTPRTGEEHRREAIALTHAPAILYLCDDDLWLPEHVEHMLKLLDGHDVANALSVWIGPTGVVQHSTLDLASEYWRAEVAARRQTPSLSVMGHTRAHYERLPHGWRSTPAGISTDSWMWTQLLEQPGVRARSGFRPTIVHLPSPQRRDMTPAQRLEELERYERCVQDPAWRRRFAEQALAGALEEAAWYGASRAELERTCAEHERMLKEVWEDRARVYAERDELLARLAASS